MQHAIIAGLVFRRTLERLAVDPRALGEMLGCVDDVIEALRDYQMEAQWIERRQTHEARGLATAAPDAALPPMQAPAQA